MGNGISVVIHTYNEEKNIRNCLECVKWADEIVVVDMYSNDKTVEIAKEYTDRIFFFENVGYADPARKFAVEKTSNEWVLIVDADELVPRRLRDRLSWIASNDSADVVYIPRNNYFFGHLMVGTKWGALQDMQPRFFKKGYMKFSPAIHDIFRICPSARIYKIGDPKEGFIHFNYVTVEHFIEKLNKYTTIEAQNIFSGLKKEHAFGYEVFTLLKEFAGRFIKNSGFRDGKVGFYLSVLMVAYKATAFLKFHLVKHFGNVNVENSVSMEYSLIAERVIGEYDE